MKNNRYLWMIGTSFLLVVAITFTICLAELGNAVLYLLMAADMLSALTFVVSSAMLSKVPK